MESEVYEFLRKSNNMVKKLEYRIKDEVYLHPTTSKKMYDLLKQAIRIIEAEKNEIE